MKKQDTLENQVNYAYLAFGSNLGDRRNNLNKALELLNKGNIFINKNQKYIVKNNGQKRLYDLRYNISNSNEDQLTNQSSELQAIANTLGDLLNKFDNEGRDKNFEGYELIDQIYTRCALLYRDLDKDILSNIATPKTDKSSKIKERVRKTDYGHIEEKFEMVNGLKNGVAKEFDKKGKIKRTLYYIDDELMSFV